MSLRREFVALAQRPGANLSELCRAFGVSRKTGHKWRDRAGDGADHSRRPHHSPYRTCAQTEQLLLKARDDFPDWGARKLKRFLENHGHTDLPAVSTITAILHRHGRIADAAEATTSTPWQRFEHAQANALWQMDFKGHFAMVHGRCHPLTVIDDHSRYNLVLHACPRETLPDVQAPLEQCFRRYGLPQRISCDNGPPWGTSQRADGLTRLGAWLIRLGIRVTHARPRHPQTNGKDERFHRTLNCGLLQWRNLLNLVDAQRAFDEFRVIYNTKRPHQALDLAVPASRYRPSDRPFPAKLPPIEYACDLPIRKVDSDGDITFRGRRFRVSRALIGLPVALQADEQIDAQFHVYFCDVRVRTINLNMPESDT